MSRMGSPTGWTRAAVLPLFALACGWLAGCATTGSVEGRVSVPGKNHSSAEAVITAARADTAAHARPENLQATIYQEDGRFVPDVLLIDPGTTVSFENRDKVFHNAFSISPAQKFDVGSIAPGQARTVKFDHPGIIQVYCELHPRELATIIVAPARGRTRPMPDGTYLLGGLPAGTYLVRAWHPDFGARSKRVAIAAREHVTVNFRY
jgi:plastocyanin